MSGPHHDTPDALEISLIPPGLKRQILNMIHTPEPEIPAMPPVQKQAVLQLLEPGRQPGHLHFASSTVSISPEAAAGLNMPPQEHGFMAGLSSIFQDLSARFHTHDAVKPDALPSNLPQKNQAQHNTAGRKAASAFKQ